MQLYFIIVNLLATIFLIYQTFKIKGLIMANPTLDDLAQKVQDEQTVEQSAIVLIDGLSAQLKAAVASNDPAKILAIANQLDANKAALAAAVAANTPATTPATDPAPATT